MTKHREPDTLQLISAAWREAGLRAPVAAPASSANLCTLSGCVSMPFVELKIATSLLSICFKHFQSVQQLQAAAPS